MTEVGPGVRRVVAPNPGLMTGPGTNTYLIGNGDLALVDPGPDDDAHLAALLEATSTGGDRLRWIMVTHTHIDHSPLAARLKKATGAQVVAYGLSPVIAGDHVLAHRAGGTGAGAGDGSGAGDVAGEGAGEGAKGRDAHEKGFVPDRRMHDGHALVAPSFRLAAVHTPGHAANHLCFDLDGLLFSGDHVMSGSTVVIAPPDGDMAEYLESLQRVRDRPPSRIAPGHGPMIDNPIAVLDQYLSHRRAREADVLARLADAGPAGASPESLVAVIYQDVKPELHPVARFSVWAHLRKLATEGFVVGEDGDRLDASWWTLGNAPAL